MIREVTAYKVDSFIKYNSGGSPTGVVLNATGLTDLQMQFISIRLGVSHTAFVFEPETPRDNIVVRFFTPTGEILNCGHGTIAAHYTRAKHFKFIGNKILFQQAKEGIQQIEIVQENQQVEIFLRQNQIRFSPAAYEDILLLLDALAINKTDLSDSFPIILASPGSNRFLIGLRSLELLNKISPHFHKLKLACNASQSIGCFIYYINSLKPRPEATARMFAPNIDIKEDTINGNSSGCLGTYLLQMTGESDLELLINQGHIFNCDGIVKVKVKKIDEHFETVIGGTAKIATEIVISLNEINNY